MVEMSGLLTSIERAVLAERERCAKVAEQIGVDLRSREIGGAIANAIRLSPAPSAGEEK